MDGWQRNCKKVLVPGNTVLNIIFFKLLIIIKYWIFLKVVLPLPWPAHSSMPCAIIHVPCMNVAGFSAVRFRSQTYHHQLQLQARN